jgi:hypothetical protein
MAEIEIPQEGCRGMELLVSRGAEGIRSLCDALDQTGPSLVPNRQRGILINEALGGTGSAREIELILNSVVYPLRMVQYQLDKTSSQVHAVVSEFIEDELVKKNNTVWSQGLLDNWNRLREPIIELLASKSATTETKTIRLLRSRANQFREVQIFSDSRPLFDDDCENIDASLITNTLRIAYRDSTRTKVIQFSLDPKDLEDFEKQIKRAKKKNERLREQNQRQGLLSLEFEAEQNDGGQTS